MILNEGTRREAPSKVLIGLSPSRSYLLIYVSFHVGFYHVFVDPSYVCYLFAPTYIILILKMRLKHESKCISRITPSKSYCLSQLNWNSYLME